MKWMLHLALAAIATTACHVEPVAAQTPQRRSTEDRILIEQMAEEHAKKNGTAVMPDDRDYAACVFYAPENYSINSIELQCELRELFKPEWRIK
jgi:hypothetical protein